MSLCLLTHSELVSVAYAPDTCRLWLDHVFVDLFLLMFNRSEMVYFEWLHCVHSPWYVGAVEMEG